MRQLPAQGSVVLLLGLVLLDCAFARVRISFFGVHNCALRWPLLTRRGLLLVRSMNSDKMWLMSSTPGPLFRPYEKLVKITLMGKELEIPENNMLLRGLQFLAPENIAYG